MDGSRNELNLNAKFFEQIPFALPVRGINIEFVRPIFLDESFTIESYIDSFGKTSASVKTKMVKSDGKLAASGDLTFVSMCKKTMKPIEWDEEFKKLFFI